MSEDRTNSSAARRFTRSATLISDPPKSDTPTALRALTLRDLVLPDETLEVSQDSIISQFPGRAQQIEELLRLFGPPGSPTLPLFIYGSPSTGKTSVILQILRSLRRPVVYSSCRSCYCPRLLFESALNQLYLHRPDASNNYSNAKRCNKPSEFINHLRDGLAKLPEDVEVEMSILYLVFDNLEAIQRWEKSSLLLSFLFNLYDMLRLPKKLAIIFVSSLPPDSYYCSESTTVGYVEPIPVYFPEYTEDDIRLALTNRHFADRKLYTSFLNVVLRPFTRVSRRMTDLSAAFQYLYSLYCEPLNDKEAIPNEEMKRKLLNLFQPYIFPYLNQSFWCLSPVSSECSTNIGKKCEVYSSEELSNMEFYMSHTTKYLLISAFLASRNPATLDASLFDSTEYSNTRKRKRKTSEKSLAQKENAEEELLIKGPGTFPLERLMAIFQCITTELECPDEEDQGYEAFGSKEGDNKFMCDVLLQLSSLFNSNFIIKSGSSPLDGVSRYRSTISEDFALKVARSLRFPLPNYLYRL